MATEFTLPDLGENITSGDVVSVLVKAGDVVSCLLYTSDAADE